MKKKYHITKNPKIPYFKKSSLKGDMLLKFSNGKYAFVWHNVDGIGDYLMAPFDLGDEESTRDLLEDLTDDLYLTMWNFKKKKLVQYPCVAIYSSNIPGRLGRADIGSRNRRPIWNRYYKIKKGNESQKI